jgi:quercetin dioxygenase-like cupin family protein
MRKHLVALSAFSAVSITAVTFAWATPGSGISPTPLARGAGGEFRIKAENFRFKLRAKDATDVALVNVKMAPNGYTGWHGHAGPSLVVVKTGQLAMYTPGKRACEVSVHNAGTTFVHPEGAHNFRNTARDASGAATETEFYIVYFVPAGGSPAAIDVTPAPEGCPA